MVIKMFVVIYFFDPIKKIKEKRKKYIKKIQKYKRIHMKKAQKIAQVGGKWPKWQAKSWKTKIYNIDKIDGPILIDKRPIWRKYLYLG